jgi:Spy/CpxP family protein refolding chaperone
MSKTLKISLLAAALVFGSGALHAAMGGHGLDGGHFMNRLGKIHDQLKLNPQQEAVWKQAEEKSRETMKQMRDSHGKTREAMKQELAKSDPDFAAVAKLADESQESGFKARRETRDLWLKLYAELSPEQKTVAKDFMRERMTRSDGMRGKFKQRPVERMSN